jgi:DNA-binding transcriptional ArsR family regulator
VIPLTVNVVTLPTLIVCDPRRIVEVDELRQVSELDAVLGADVLMLMAEVFIRLREPIGRIPPIEERNVIARPQETVAAIDDPDVHRRDRPFGLLPYEACELPRGRIVRLTYSDMGICYCMARAATTADAFNAVAEPRRRQILDVLAGGERPVNDLVAVLGLNQPQVSKHLRVLREVGAVDVRGQGRQRLYRLNGRALKPIHDWVKDYERTWSERFSELDVVLEDLKQKEEGDARSGK